MVIQSNILLRTFKKIRLGLLIGILLGCILFYFIYFSETGRAPSLVNNFRHLVLTIFIICTSAIVLSYVNRLLNSRLSWNTQLALRLSIGLVSNIIIVGLILWLEGSLFLLVGTDIEGLKSLWSSNPDLISKIVIITILTVLIYTVFNFALYSYNQYTYSHIKNAQTKRKYLGLQFEVLKSQLSPHYLFNCLNTISSLVFKDASMAEDFIRRLASTYRYILENNKKKYVTLEEEVEFVKSYNYLLQVRFETYLKLEINLPPNIMSTKIPPITLQLLVENAVKHNTINKNNPLNIYIGAIDNTVIRVSNTKTEQPSGISSFNVGLNNIISRYEYLTDQKIRIDNSEKYTVTLPVIQNELAQTS